MNPIVPEQSPQQIPQPPTTFSARHSKQIAIGIVVAIPVLIVAGIILIMVNYSSNKPVDKNVGQNSVATSAGTKKVINHTITTDLGYQITLNEVVTGFEAPYIPKTVDPYIIKVTIVETPAAQYTGTSPYPSDFVLVVDGKEISDSTYDDRITDDDLAKVGYSPLADKEVTKAASNVGYIQRAIPKGKTPTVLRFHQHPYSVLLPSGTIPAKSYDIPIQ